MSLRIRLAAGTIIAALALGCFQEAVGPAAQAQSQAQNFGMRAVNGVVYNADSAPVESATVFLRNTKTKSIRSYTTTKEGRFRFVQVNMSEDYDLWAEKDGKKSATKTVSSWDSRTELEIELKMK